MDYVDERKLQPIHYASQIDTLVHIHEKKAGKPQIPRQYRFHGIPVSSKLKTREDCNSLGLFIPLWVQYPAALRRNEKEGRTFCLSGQIPRPLAAGIIHLEYNYLISVFNPIAQGEMQWHKD